MITSLDKKNAIWNSGTFIILSLLGFVSFSLTIKSFDPSVIGLFILLNSILGFGTSIDFGFGMSTIKFISEAKTENNYDLINSIIVSFLIVYILTGVVISLIMLFYYYNFLRGSGLLSVINTGEIDFIFHLLIITYLFRYISNYLRTVIEGYSEFILSCKLSIAVTFINFLLIIILFIFKLSISYLAVIYLTVSIISVILYIYSILFSLKNAKIKLSYFNFALLKKYSVYGYNIQISFLIGNAIDPVIKYLTGSFLSLSFVTFYETAKKIIDITNGIILSANKSVFNIISEHNIKKTLKEFVNEKLYIFSKASNYYNFVIYGVVNPLMCYFIILWFKSYEAMLIFLILILPFTLISIGAPLYSVIMMQSKGKILLLIQTINFILVFLCLYISLKLTGNFLGLFAYYLATINSQFLIYFFLKKNYDFDFRKYFSEIRFNDLIKLNIILIIQLSVVYIFPDKLNYILIAFFLIYLFIFWNYITFLIKKIYNGASEKLFYLIRN